MPSGFPPPPPHERADAARNRRAILAAADELFATHRPDQVSMEAVALRAGVGKGTVFRRFGDRHGLLLALLDEDERRLQDAILGGPPPLGPGAPPVARLEALVRALVDLLERRGDVILASETSTPGSRLRGGAYAAWHQHVCVLLKEAGVRRDRPELAHVLLAPLAASTYWSLRREQGVRRASLERSIRGLWRAAVAATGAIAT